MRFCPCSADTPLHLTPFKPDYDLALGNSRRSTHNNNYDKKHYHHECYGYYYNSNNVWQPKAGLKISH